MRSWTRPLGLSFLVIVGCQKMGCQKNAGEGVYSLRNLSFSYTPEQIDKACTTERERLLAELKPMGALGKEAKFSNTALVLERSLTEMQQALMPMIFLKYVSDSAPAREAGHRCETAVEQMQVELFAREDLYSALKQAKNAHETLPAQDTKLLDEFLLAFRRNGLELSSEKRAVFVEKKKKIVELQNEFSKVLNEWNEYVEMTREQLAGMPDDFVNRLKKTQTGKYQVTVKYPDYYPFMENATNADARKLLEEKFFLRGGQKNKERLDQVLKLRDETAQMLGYKNHAEYVLDDQMAKTPQAVASFLTRVGGKLKEQGKKDLRDLLEAKREELKDPHVKEIHSHDWRYYDNQIKKTKHQIDSQAIKEYFPLDVVNRGMFEIYQTLLGVEFIEDRSINTWHASVTPYRVEKDGTTVAIFFMDLFPRDGKYGHAAAFTLYKGFVKEDGSYSVPVSSIVANFNPPGENSPSLLEHGEVETLFHEFGHIMHQVLTTAKHASLSGTSVKRDFVEAPSQMLENWVWNPETLAKLSGHYKTKKPLPQEQVTRLVNAKLLHVGIRYLRQLLFATLDQRYHTSVPRDTTAVYAELARDIMLIPIPEGTLPQAGFGHLMGGYDAGYYGYLWSEVFAADMFTRFEKEGLLSEKAGQDYLKWILQPGGEIEPQVLIKNFLGREPNEAAFFKSLGL